MAHLAFYLGSTVMILAGTGFAVWSKPVAARLNSDEDGNPTPVAPGTILWTRVVGAGMILFGLLLLWDGPAAFQGPVDSVGF